MEFPSEHSNILASTDFYFKFRTNDTVSSSTDFLLKILIFLAGRPLTAGVQSGHCI